MLVGTAPGGINDISARLAARWLGRFIPGNPTIVVQNQPGAGGLVTANRMFNASEKDGSVIAKLERATPQLQIQGHPQAQFDPMKFVWLGSLSSYADDAYLMLINADNPARSIDDIKPKGPHKITLGANNAASSNLIFGIIAREALKLNVDVVRGYTGAAPLFLAMQRKEIDGQLVGLSSVKTGQRDLWEKKAFRALMQFGRTSRHPEFADIPTGRELAGGDADALALLEFAELPFFMALPFIAPPGIPAERATALQDAFMRMARDKAFSDEAEKLGIDMSPIDAAAILKLLTRVAATPKSVIDRYTSLDKHEAPAR
jgi:tripartite-type tricarboxylate transporter receptor subunit TctC